MTAIQITVDLSPDTKAWLEKLLGGVVHAAVCAKVEALVAEPVVVPAPPEALVAPVVSAPVRGPATLAERIALAKTEADLTSVGEEVTKSDEATKAAYYAKREEITGKAPPADTRAGKRAAKATAAKHAPSPPPPVSFEGLPNEDQIPF